jgi:hypothetical protein
MAGLSVNESRTPMPASKSKPGPLAPWKRAVTVTTRTIAGSPALDAAFTSGTAGYDGKTARLPWSGRS